MLTLSADHVYRWNGEIVPGLNEKLTAEGMQDFSCIPPDRLAAAMYRGNYVHKATELFDKGKLREETLKSEFVPYIDGWKKFRIDYKPVILSIEGGLYSKLRNLAGTHDRVVRIGGCVVLVDIKTYAQMKWIDGVKLAAYKILWDEHNPKDKIRKRMIVHLTEKGYKISICNNLQDMSDFLLCNSMYKLKKRRGLIK